MIVQAPGCSDSAALSNLCYKRPRRHAFERGFQDRAPATLISSTNRKKLNDLLGAYGDSSSSEDEEEVDTPPEDVAVAAASSSVSFIMNIIGRIGSIQGQ
jgi:hypothetical protein